MPPDLDVAKGHLAASITLGMLLEPHIVHVVGYCEAGHAATAVEIVESCRIVRGAIQHALAGLPNVSRDAAITKRQRQLIREAKLILDAMRGLGSGEQDPLTDPDTLGRAVRVGILDAPHLCGSGVAPGKVNTLPVAGAQFAVGPRTGKPLSEGSRLRSLI